MVPFEGRNEKLFTAIMARLRDRRSSPQAKLVSTLSGQSVSVNVILLSMVSKNMSSMLRDVMSNSDGIVKIMVPVEIGVLENLVKFIGKGCAYFHSMAEVVAVEQAAKMLGISIGNWEVKSGVTEEEIKIVKKIEKGSQIKKEYNCKLCQTTFREKRSLTRHEVQVHGATSTAATYSCETCMKTYYKKHSLDRHNLSKKHKKRLLLNSTSALHNSPTNPTKSLKKKVSRILPMKKKVKLNKASKPPVSGHKKYRLVDGKWVCTICHVAFTWHFKLNAHLDQTHNVKIDEYTCNQYTSYIQRSLKLHKKSKKHLQRCAEWTVSKEQDGQGDQEQDGQGEQEQNGQGEQDLVMYSCNHCQTTFLTLNKYNHHLKSKKHKKRQKEEEYQAKPDNNNKG